MKKGGFNELSKFLEQKDKIEKNNNPVKPDYINKSKNIERYNVRKLQNDIKK